MEVWYKRLKRKTVQVKIQIISSLAIISLLVTQKKIIILSNIYSLQMSYNTVDSKVFCSK